MELREGIYKLWLFKEHVIFEGIPKDVIRGDSQLLST